MENHFRHFSLLMGNDGGELLCDTDEGINQPMKWLDELEANGIHIEKWEDRGQRAEVLLATLIDEATIVDEEKALLFKMRWA